MKFLKSNLILKFSLFFNIIFIILIILVLLVLFRFGILTPFSSTKDTLSQIPVFNESSIRIEEFATGIEIPWDIEFLDDETILVTERTGKVRLIRNGILQEAPALDLITQIVSIGEAGLMGITKHPAYNENKFVYIYHTYKSEGDSYLKISRYKFDNDKLISEEIILSELPTGSVHSGGQLEFGPDGKLYVTTGDVASADLAQDLDSLAGKTLRINDDGTVPNDNPYFDSTNGISTMDFVYSYGHRNAQGLDWHPITHEMYQSEHGPSGWDGPGGFDEINQIKRGGNYGWPEIVGDEKRNGMYSPLIVYSPAIAPASLTFYKGEMFPELKNYLLVGALRGNALIAIDVDSNEVVEKYRLVDSEYGRIRFVTTAPDGSIYFTTSNRDGRGTVNNGDDKIYRISK